MFVTFILLYVHPQLGPNFHPSTLVHPNIHVPTFPHLFYNYQFIQVKYFKPQLEDMYKRIDWAAGLLFQHLKKYLDMSGNIWTLFDISGHGLTSLDMSGHLWTCLVWTCLVWTCLVWTCLVWTWLVWTCLDMSHRLDWAAAELLQPSVIPASYFILHPVLLEHRRSNFQMFLLQGVFFKKNSEKVKVPRLHFFIDIKWAGQAVSWTLYYGERMLQHLFFYGSPTQTPHWLFCKTVSLRKYEAVLRNSFIEKIWTLCHRQTLRAVVFFFTSLQFD